MAVFRETPYPGMNFLVDLGTGQAEGREAGLLEVVFPEAMVQVIEYRSGNDAVNEPIKIQSVTRYGNLVLRRSVIGSLNWYAWWNSIRNGDTATRTITVNLVTEDHTTTVFTWKFLRARPVGYRFSPLNALGTQLLIESLEIAFERLELE